MAMPEPGNANAAQRLPISGSDLLIILILTLGGSRLLLPLVASVLDVSGPDNAGLELVLLLLGVQIVVLFGVVYGVAVRWKGCTWRDLGFVPLPPGWGIRAVAIALISFPLVGGVSWLQQQITGQSFQNPQLEILSPPVFSWWAYLGTLFIAGVLAPLAEEITFRGLLFRWLDERYGFTIGIVVSAFAFSILHGIPGLIPAIMVLGAVLAWTYARTGSIWVPIIVHGTYNAIVTTILYAAIAQGLSPSNI